MKCPTAIVALALAGSVAAAPHSHGKRHQHVVRDAATPPPAQTVPGVAAGCSKWYTVASGDYCQKVADTAGISLQQFYAWNPQVNTNGPCASLWAGYAYCIGVDGSVSSAPAPAPAPAAPAPAPSASATTVAPAPPTTAPAPSTTASSPPPYSTGGSTTGGSTTGASAYVSYHGDGSTSDGWPSMDKWVSFDIIWDGNLPNMQISCTNNAWGVSNSPRESATLKSAIIFVARSAGLDPRFVLAIVLQESWGCVRVVTTNYGVSNPGVMQDHNGQHSCHGAAADACADDTIVGMIQDGTLGTWSSPGGGDGLQQTYGAATGSGAQKYYQAAKLYNGGSIADPSRLEAGCCTKSYASDVANTLLGFNKPSRGPWQA